MLGPRILRLLLISMYTNQKKERKVKEKKKVEILKINSYIPVPWQYLHLLFSCCSTLLASSNIKAAMTPTAPPEKDATIGST